MVYFLSKNDLSLSEKPDLDPYGTFDSWHDVLVVCVLDKKTLKRKHFEKVSKMQGAMYGMLKTIALPKMFFLINEIDVYKNKVLLNTFSFFCITEILFVLC